MYLLSDARPSRTTATGHKRTRQQEHQTSETTAATEGPLSTHGFCFMQKDLCARDCDDCRAVAEEDGQQGDESHHHSKRARTSTVAETALPEEYFESYEDLSVHHLMLSDRSRCEAYQKVSECKTFVNTES